MSTKAQRRRDAILRNTVLIKNYHKVVETRPSPLRILGDHKDLRNVPRIAYGAIVAISASHAYILASHADFVGVKTANSTLMRLSDPAKGWREFRLLHRFEGTGFVVLRCKMHSGLSQEELPQIAWDYAPKDEEELHSCIWEHDTKQLVFLGGAYDKSCKTIDMVTKSGAPVLNNAAQYLGFVWIRKDGLIQLESVSRIKSLIMEDHSDEKELHKFIKLVMPPKANSEDKDKAEAAEPIVASAKKVKSAPVNSSKLASEKSEKLKQAKPTRSSTAPAKAANVVKDEVLSEDDTAVASEGDESEASGDEGEASEDNATLVEQETADEEEGEDEEEEDEDEEDGGDQEDPA